MKNIRGARRRERVVLAFAGDVATSVAVRWLAETDGVDVVAVTVDFGHSRDLEDIRDRALALGALRAHVLDAREEFARLYLSPALRADALNDGRRRLAAALGHAVIAGKLVEIAGIEQAIRVAHCGVTSAGRLTAAVHSLKPAFTVLAPACEWGMSGAGLLEYAAERRLPLPLPGLDAPSRSPVAETTVRHGGEAAMVDITFKAGIPVALNGIGMPLLDLIGSLDFLAGKNGVGRCEQFETPAVSVLAAAHNQLQQRVSTGEMHGFSRTVGRQYAELVENGGWFSLLRAALDAYVDRVQQVVNGVVRVKLHEGVCEIAHSHVSDGQENDDNAVVGPLRHRA